MIPKAKPHHVFIVTTISESGRLNTRVYETCVYETIQIHVYAVDDYIAKMIEELKASSLLDWSITVWDQPNRYTKLFQISLSDLATGSDPDSSGVDAIGGYPGRKRQTSEVDSDEYRRWLVPNQHGKDC